MGGGGAALTGHWPYILHCYWSFYISFIGAAAAGSMRHLVIWFIRWQIASRINPCNKKTISDLCTNREFYQYRCLFVSDSLYRYY